MHLYLVESVVPDSGKTVLLYYPGFCVSQQKGELIIFHSTSYEAAVEAARPKTRKQNVRAHAWSRDERAQ